MKRIPPIHPGEVLQEEFLTPLGVTHYRLAKAMGVDQPRVAAICQGRRAITADTALRLARVLGTSEKLWLGLQQDYDVEQAREALGEDLGRLEPVVSAASGSEIDVVSGQTSGRSPRVLTSECDEQSAPFDWPRELLLAVVGRRFADRVRYHTGWAWVIDLEFEELSEAALRVEQQDDDDPEWGLTVYLNFADTMNQ